MVIMIHSQEWSFNMSEPACPDCLKKLEVIEDLEERLYRCRACGVEYTYDELIGLPEANSWSEEDIS